MYRRLTNQTTMINEVQVEFSWHWLSRHYKDTHKYCLSYLASIWFTLNHANLIKQWKVCVHIPLRWRDSKHQPNSTWILVITMVWLSVLSVDWSPAAALSWLFIYCFRSIYQCWKFWDIILTAVVKISSKSCTVVVLYNCVSPNRGSFIFSNLQLIVFFFFG